MCTFLTDAYRPHFYTSMHEHATSAPTDTLSHLHFLRKHLGIKLSLYPLLSLFPTESLTFTRSLCICLSFYVNTEAAAAV